MSTSPTVPLSKEQILDNCGDSYHLPEIIQAMDIWGKQQSIAFVEWIRVNAYSDGDVWYLHEKMSGEIYYPEQLYELYTIFINSQNK